MRAGQNPAKFIDQVGHAERITVAILTHIPYLHGYYKDALDVLSVSLQSLREHTGLPYELLVFDNGSGGETVEQLYRYRREGLINYLMLSTRNLGKGKAWEVIFNAAPGEIIAYADSDVYYSPGWLRAGLDLLETYPRAGMVTCRPLRTLPELYSSSLAWAQGDPDAQLEQGAFIPWQVFREHDLNLGQEEAQIRARFEQTQDVRVRYRDHVALLGAGHWQFIARKDVLSQLTPLGIERPLGEDRKLDQKLNANNYLRLMTIEPFVRHLGNVLPADLSDRPLKPETAVSRRDLSFFQRTLRLRPVRFILMAIYNRIFRWYFHD
jgi:glycosyltransferase involved in cell wall biosynthesis